MERGKVKRKLTNGAEDALPSRLAVAIKWLRTSAPLAARHRGALGAVLALVTEAAAGHRPVARVLSIKSRT